MVRPLTDILTFCDHVATLRTVARSSRTPPRQADRSWPAHRHGTPVPVGRHHPAGTIPIGLDLFRDWYRPYSPGISTDSARGPETTGNNRHDSGKPDTRRARPTHQWNGPPPQVNDRYIRRSELPNVQPRDRPPDQHPLDLGRPLKNCEDSGLRAVPAGQRPA
jgi:hypothetical protein